MERFFPRTKEERISDLRKRRMEETSRRHRRTKASSEEIQGPEGAVTPKVDGWMDGWKEVMVM
jgi:hypothetical protein